MASLGPKVVLPSDLPHWQVIQEHLTILQSETSLSAQDVAQGMLQIHNIANISCIDGEERLDVDLGFDSFKTIVDEQFSDAERDRFLTKTLPCMARYALTLNELKPRNGLGFSLQGFARETKLDRRFVASLIANIFFSTFPLRSSWTLPVLPDASFPSLFGSTLESLPQALMLKNLLNYFDILDEEQPSGHVAFFRSSPNIHKSKLFPRFASKELPLAPIYVLPDPKPFDIHANFTALTLKQIYGDPSAPCSNLILHPELLVVKLFMEDLEPHECLKVTGLLSTRKEFHSSLGPDSKYLITGGTEENQAQSVSHTLEHLLSYIAQDEGNRENHEGAESSQVSSKSQLLEDLADQMSMRADSETKSNTSVSILSESDHSSVDEANWRLSCIQKKVPSKPLSKFSDRLKAALARGNTPDSDMSSQPSVPVSRNCSRKLGALSSADRCSRRGSDGFRLDHDDKDQGCEDACALFKRKKFKEQRTKLASWSGDSSYSFEIAGGLDSIEVEYEEILSSFTKSHESENPPKNRERFQALSRAIHATHRRGMSDSWEAIALSIERSAVGENITFAKLQVPIHPIWRRSQSFCLTDSSLLNTPVLKESLDGQESTNEGAKSSYILIHDGSQEFNEGCFILRWLIVSLAGYPLMVYQSDSHHDLSHVFDICHRVDLLKWTTKELSQVVLDNLKTGGSSEGIMLALKEKLQ